MFATRCFHCGHKFTEAELAHKKAMASMKISHAAKAMWEARRELGEAYRAPQRRLYGKIYELLDGGKSPKEVACALDISIGRISYAIQVRRLDKMREQMKEKT